MAHHQPSPGQIASLACLFEATARKPGNVHRFADFDYCSYVDFLMSAQAIAAALDSAPERGVGLSVLAAVSATRRVVATCPNFGLILILAPLAAAPPPPTPLSEGVEKVLEATTVDDARRVYEAIRLAQPGGLGEVDEQDASSVPTVTLRETMRLAEDRDSLARQYVNGYADVVDIGLPRLARLLAEGRSIETAVIGTHLEFMARLPDTLIARKAGRVVAEESARRAGDVLAAGWPDGEAAAKRLDELDAWLRADGHVRNPGTTADLVAATLYSAIRDRVIRLPLAATAWSGAPHQEAN